MAKIGVLTYHMSHNYGAFLQAYALVMRLKEEYPNIHIELINYNMKAADKHYKEVVFRENHGRTIIYNLKRYFMFNREKRMLPVSREELHTDDINEFQNFVKGKYDLIIAGSDEIWRVSGFRGFPTPYWLPGDLNCVKMAYAVSSRSNISNMDVKNKEKIKKYVNSFQYIGVRDEATKRELEMISKKQVYKNCDPVFLYNFEYNKEKGKCILEKKFKVDLRKRTIGIMVDDINDLKAVQSLLGNKYNYVALYRKHPQTKAYACLTPLEWIDVMSAVDFIVTSYFHGMCFAIILGIPFLATEKNKSIQESSKCFELLHEVGLDNQYVRNIDKENLFLADWIKTEIGKHKNYSWHLEKIQQEAMSFITEVGEVLLKKGN